MHTVPYIPYHAIPYCSIPYCTDQACLDGVMTHDELLEISREFLCRNCAVQSSRKKLRARKLEGGYIWECTCLEGFGGTRLEKLPSGISQSLACRHN
jgi:hypothetical protein